MDTFLCFTVRFLDGTFHGRRDGDEPEWPPSPLRLLQALAAAAAARWNERTKLDRAATALCWLERQSPPSIVAPRAVSVGVGYRLYVPDNVGDKVAAAWCRGNLAASMADYRTEKHVRPLRLLDGDAVHYLYRLGDPEFETHRQVLFTAARSITHVGWGIDIVFANATVITEEETRKLPGDRWLPGKRAASVSLRTPKQGTVDDLIRRHTAFLHRLVRDDRENECFNPVPPLSAYRVIGYRRATDPAPFPFAAFKLLTPDGSGYRPFEPTGQAAVVAGMLRHALYEVAQKQRPFDWDDAQIARIVLGHDANGKAIRSDPFEPRFAYLPLPTVEHRGQSTAPYHVGSIRRVLVVGMPGMEREIDWVRRALSGAELLRERDQARMATLSPIPSGDWVVQQCCRPSSVWATVTPVILPGYDDRRPQKTEKLLRKALLKAAFSSELAEHAALDWRKVGYLPGVDLASRYRRPRNINEAPVCHVRIQWHDGQGLPIQLPGPLAIGSGRFRGLGLFVALGGR